MKTTATVLAGILIALSFGLAIYFNQGALHAKRLLDRERYTRLTAEENFEKANAQIQDLERELARVANKAKNTERLLEQTQAVNAELQERVNKARDAQTSIEEKVKESEQSPANQGRSEPDLRTEAGAT